MALVIVIRNKARVVSISSHRKPKRRRGWWLWQRTADGGRRVSPLALRILAVNSLALFILLAGVLYLGDYEKRLVHAELDLLRTEARLFANALGEGAVIINLDERETLSRALARQMVRSLAEVSDNRTRLYDDKGKLIADSRILAEGGRRIEIENLDDQKEGGSIWSRGLRQFQYTLSAGQTSSSGYRLLRRDTEDTMPMTASVEQAQHGEDVGNAWLESDGTLLLTMAAPIARYKQVLGVVFLSHSGDEIDQTLAGVRLNVMQIFIAVLLITVLLSLYLARAIAQPIKLLADAVEGVRAEQANQTALGGAARLLLQRPIPDFPGRQDEIGELSDALKAMTVALGERMTAIENFAADVAHEIKNPLTSLRSAVETAGRVSDPAVQQRLMAVIHDDVDRLDRLISDISAASRLDAELSRAEQQEIDLNAMLTTLADIYANHDNSNRVAVAVSVPVQPVKILGLEGRLMQVFTNLVDNAISFSPPQGMVAVAAATKGHQVLITVDDQGQGIPENKLAAIFDRFYSERPKGEKFGMHSGLGLSIAKQIIEAHRGKIWAENLHDPAGQVTGARFSIVLPAK